MSVDLHNVLMIGRYLTWEIKRAKKKKNIKRIAEKIVVGNLTYLPTLFASFMI